jgi:hemolysin III
MKELLKKPFLRGAFHQAMFFIAIGACAPLIVKSNNSSEYIATSIYSCAVMMMFGFSALYHRFNWNQIEKRQFRKLDHIGIFLMIAGTFTPFCLLVLPWSSGLILLILIWSIALFGILQVLFIPDLNRIIRALIYMGMGLIALPYMSEMFKVFSTANIALIIIGSFLYIIGAIGYGLKIPKLSPRFFGYHEVFHSLVSVAAILHFIVIYSII